ncbi:hypothetical protein PC118_g18876 [Phytophthora cactorum]|uniref:Chromo domain-containing protein n=1 Tax=Phytophthora cactorum TaxID=29920 RepID=A0A8T1F3N5_9STRA|nr:hypothetical protein PC113_g15227 [Phytophthora cactorum]KAG2906104.1 hypothetical protein PC115_g14384 [Phytophthora cactorum]KAG2966932.1 hypothetical protein PC118_g18876 [Phytophthora cactorum]KAG3149608.1 hypothetical protein C6341_g16988 [Phytophthora cactorum]
MPSLSSGTSSGLSSLCDLYRPRVLADGDQHATPIPTDGEVFAKYNFRVEYKPGKIDVLTDALSRRPDYELAHITRVTTDLYDQIRMAYRNDESLASLVRFLTAGKEAKSERLSPRQRSRLHRYEWQDGLLYYRVEPHEPPRVIVPNDEDLKFDILQEAHDAPSSGHLGREKIFLSVSQAFWWTHMYKRVARYVKTCETCQRVKPAGHASVPLQSLPIPADCWKSLSLDFVFGLPADDHGNTGILVFVCRLSKMVHLASVPDTVTGEHAARLFVDGVFRHHGLPETFVSDRDPRFTAAFWQTLFQLLGSRLHMSNADHPQTDRQTERVNPVLEDTLRSFCAASPRTWSERLPVVKFALNNAVHVSTGFTPFCLNGMRHPRVPLTLRGGTESSILSGGEARKALSSQVSDLRPVSLRKQVESFIDPRLNVINRVRDAMAIAQDRQKEYSDKHGRGNVNLFKVGDLVLLDTRNLPLDTVSSVGSNKLKHRFIEPFAVLARHGASYTVDLPKSKKTHPTFYMGRLKRYHDPQGPAAPQTPQASREEEDPTPRNENQLQPSSNVQRRKAKTHAALVDREASGTPERLRTVKPQLGKPSTHHSHTAESTAERTRKSASPSAVPGHEGHPGPVEAGGKPHPHRTRAPGDQPDHGFPRSPGPIGAGGLQASRGPRDSRPGRQHHRQSRDPERSRGQERVDGDGQPPRFAAESQSQAVHSAERSAPQEVPRTRSQTRAPPPLLDRNGETHYHVKRVVRERRLDGKRQLLVKWRVYPDSQNSWEPIERLHADCPKAVAIWEQKRRQLRE